MNEKEWNDLTKDQQGDWIECWSEDKWFWDTHDWNDTSLVEDNSDESIS